MLSHMLFCIFLKYTGYILPLKYCHYALIDIYYLLLCHRWFENLVEFEIHEFIKQKNSMRKKFLIRIKHKRFCWFQMILLPMNQLFPPWFEGCWLFSSINIGFEKDKKFGKTIVQLTFQLSKPQNSLAEELPNTQKFLAIREKKVFSCRLLHRIRKV